MPFLHSTFSLSFFFFFTLHNLTFRKSISVNEQWPDSIVLISFRVLLLFILALRHTEQNRAIVNVISNTCAFPIITSVLWNNPVVTA